MTCLRKAFHCAAPRIVGFPVVGAAQWHDFLKQIIESTSATLFAQPVLKFTSMGIEVVHKEIFLRLPDEDGELIMAGVFMPMAERTGLATALDKLTISKLLEYLSANPEGHYLYALNLTSTSLHDPKFVEWLCNRIQADLDTGRRIVFELPEFGVLGNIENTRTIVDRLSALGCGCGIDHFGRGFNSLGYLHSIKVQYLKIDGGYTRDINHDADNQFFIRALADAAHSIDICVFAAAVETEDESDAVRSLHVDGIQGYLVGKPEPL